MLLADFDFDADPQTWPKLMPPIDGLGDHEASVGRSNFTTNAKGVTWSRLDLDPGADGLLYKPTPLGGLLPIRPCPDPWICEARVGQWQPSLGMRTDGYFLICWSDAEDETLLLPPFNIRMQLFDAYGNKVGGEVVVNQPSLELNESIQYSPAVSFDDAGNIVATWVGRELADCPGSFQRQIYARRFHWDGTSQAPYAVSSEFIVNSDANFVPAYNFTENIFPRPSVSLSKSLNSRFIVAWNAEPVGPGNKQEVHAQYFQAARPLGGEFRVHHNTGGEINRSVGNSAQHTICYGPDDEVVCAWTRYDHEMDTNQVYFTRLPACFWEYQESVLPCLKGDLNGDGLINGLDIAPFVELFTEPDLHCLSRKGICAADTDNDGDVDFLDVECFVSLLLGGGCLQTNAYCTENGDSIVDCNANGIPDANDIASGASEDCNNNFIPDECDIDPADPDGDGQVSNDLNGNGIPDECEPDCNDNGVPDDKDIDDQTSNDINTNGIPDECEADCNNNSVPDAWDVSQGTSADCNNNDVPDECEYDCNVNGVPDDCDIDPTDPDGDGQVSPDCNANNMPDACDLARSLLQSYDCNDNGIPDECDIDSGTSEDCNDNGFPDECDLTRPRRPSPDCNANGIPDECDLADCPPGVPACDDCNANGIPDECDIASGTSQDTNTNGIPDECEGAGPMGGGSYPMPGPFPLPAPGAYQAFMDWSMTQTWGPTAGTTGAEQHQMIIDKLEELGLPLENPWMFSPPMIPLPMPMP